VQKARPQRAHSALSNTLNMQTLKHVQNKRRRMAFYAIAQRLHSVPTALLATAQRAPQRSATFWNTVETL